MSESVEQRAPHTAGPEARRFSAFISYSHADERFAKHLHRKLETYRLPRSLAGSGSSRRLKAIFRDSDELAAAFDLTTAVRDAIAQSDFLIVVCSVASAQSHWVGREIELFLRWLKSHVSRLASAEIRALCRYFDVPVKPLKAGAGDAVRVP